MMRRLMVSTLAAAALSALGVTAATPAAAATVSGIYTGHITSVDPGLAGTFAVNDPYVIAFSYDDSVPDTDAADPKFGHYVGSVTESVAVGGSIFASASPGSITVTNNTFLPDEITMQLGLPSSPPPINGYTLWAASLTLDGPPTLLSSDALPQSFLPLSLLSAGQFGLGFTDGVHEADVFGVLDIPVTATPIPGALPLFLTALGGLCFVRRGRRRLIR